MPLKDQVAKALEDKATERQAIQDAIAKRKLEIEQLVETENRDATDAELESVIAKTEELRELDEKIASLEVRFTVLKEIEEREANAAAKAKEIRTPQVSVQEPLTYRADNRHEVDFLQDAIKAQFNDRDAQERIGRHQAEMRAIGTAALEGLTIPQYATDLAAPLLRAGRPTADAVRKLALPSEGMVIPISRITTGSATAVQASENASVQNTDMDDTVLNVNVRTIAGQQDVSLQAWQRSRGTSDLVLQDLIASYHTTLNSQIINADGNSGTHLGILSTLNINSVTYTDATPTAAELYPKVADAIQRVAAGTFRPATGIIMHPRRWGWLSSAVDGQGRPVVVPNANGPQNAHGVGAAGYGVGVGTFLGLPVITDASIPTNLGAGTNQDPIIVANLDELLLWENEGPLGLEFRETNAATLGVKVVVHGFSAFTAGRYPAAVSVINGTGLVAPTF